MTESMHHHALTILQVTFPNDPLEHLKALVDAVATAFENVNLKAAAIGSIIFLCIMPS